MDEKEKVYEARHVQLQWGDIEIEGSSQAFEPILLGKAKVDQAMWNFTFSPRTGRDILFHVKKEPNRFHRFFQKLILGVTWKKDND